MPSPEASSRRRMIAGAVRLASIAAMTGLSLACPPPDLGLLWGFTVVIVVWPASYLWYHRRVRTTLGLAAAVAVAAVCLAMWLQAIPYSRWSAGARAKAIFPSVEASMCRLHAKSWAESLRRYDDRGTEVDQQLLAYWR